MKSFFRKISGLFSNHEERTDEYQKLREEIAVCTDQSIEQSNNVIEIMDHFSDLYRDVERNQKFIMTRQETIMKKMGILIDSNISDFVSPAEKILINGIKQKQFMIGDVDGIITKLTDTEERIQPICLSDFLLIEQRTRESSVFGIGSAGLWVVDLSTFVRYVHEYDDIIRLLPYAVIEELIHSFGIGHDGKDTLNDDWTAFFIEQFENVDEIDENVDFRHENAKVN